MLIIDEHTAMEGRHIFDQDNKGWKAVSNAIKGRLIPDDDQHTLAVALLFYGSAKSGVLSYHRPAPCPMLMTFSPHIPVTMPPETSISVDGADGQSR